MTTEYKTLNELCKHIAANKDFEIVDEFTGETPQGYERRINLEKKDEYLMVHIQVDELPFEARICAQLSASTEGSPGKVMNNLAYLIEKRDRLLTKGYTEKFSDKTEFCSKDYNYELSAKSAEDLERIINDFGIYLKTRR